MINRIAIKFGAFARSARRSKHMPLGFVGASKLVASIPLLLARVAESPTMNEDLADLYLPGGEMNRVIQDLLDTAHRMKVHLHDERHKQYRVDVWFYMRGAPDAAPCAHLLALYDIESEEPAVVSWTPNIPAPLAASK